MGLQNQGLLENLEQSLMLGIEYLLCILKKPNPRGEPEIVIANQLLLPLWNQPEVLEMNYKEVSDRSYL